MLVVGDGSLKDFSILLPCADMDLKKLLDLDDPIDFSVTDLIKASCRVADAIRWLHDGNHIDGQPEKLTCCHMDLKLDNVLVYEWERRRQNGLPVGVWKISDFGISTLEEAPQRAPSLRGLRAPVESLKALTSNTPRTIRIQGKQRSPACQAPELNSPGGKIGRSSDVWSFGCILFQVLARGVGPGKSEMLKLDRLRCLELDEVTLHRTDYFYRVNNETRSFYLNPHVKKWLTSKGGFDSYPVRHCKELILQMLDLDPEKRPKSKVVVGKLSLIAHKPGNDPTSELREESSAVESNLDLLSDETPLNPAAVPQLVFELDTPATAEKEPETPRPSDVTPASIATNPPPHSSPTIVYLPAQADWINLTVDVPSNQTPKVSTFARNPANSPAQGTDSSSNSHTQPIYVTNRQDVNGSHTQPPFAVRQNLISSSTQHTSVAIHQGFNEELSFHSNAVPRRRPLPPTASRPESGVARTSSSTQSSNSRSQGNPSNFSTDNAVFREVKDVLVALISPASAILAFITQRKIYIRTIFSQISHCNITTHKNYRWELGNIAGDFLCVVGTNTAHKKRVRICQVRSVSASNSDRSASS